MKRLSCACDGTAYPSLYGEPILKYKEKRGAINMTNTKEQIRSGQTNEIN